MASEQPVPKQHVEASRYLTLDEESKAHHNRLRARRAASDPRPHPPPFVAGAVRRSGPRWAELLRWRGPVVTRWPPRRRRRRPGRASAARNALWGAHIAVPAGTVRSRTGQIRAVARGL